MNLKHADKKSVTSASFYCGLKNALDLIVSIYERYRLYNTRHLNLYVVCVPGRHMENIWPISVTVYLSITMLLFTTQTSSVWSVNVVNSELSINIVQKTPDSHQDPSAVSKKKNTQIENNVSSANGLQIYVCGGVHYRGPFRISTWTFWI